MNKHSLRDIKKEATAQAIANASFELARERGLDGFVVEDVVQRAGYSRRTFANYFSCKEEAVVMGAVSINGIAEAEREIGDLPLTATPLDALQQWMRLQLTTDLLWRMRELVFLSKRHPTLEPYILSVFHQLQLKAQEALNSVFHGRYPDGYTQMLAGAVYGAIQPIMDGSLHVRFPDDPASGDPEVLMFEQYLDTMFGYLRKGF